MDVQERSSAVNETVISCVEASNLKRILTGNYTELRWLRIMYGKQIEAMLVSLQKAYYRKLTETQVEMMT